MMKIGADAARAVDTIASGEAVMASRYDQRSLTHCLPVRACACLNALIKLAGPVAWAALDRRQFDDPLTSVTFRSATQIRCRSNILFKNSAAERSFLALSPAGPELTFTSDINKDWIHKDRNKDNLE